jgi:hypothetical protein
MRVAIWLIALAALRHSGIMNDLTTVDAIAVASTLSFMLCVGADIVELINGLNGLKRRNENT